MKLSQAVEMRQTLSLQEMQSLQMLTMNNGDVYEFLQNEQLENPMLELCEAMDDTMQSIGTWMESVPFRPGAIIARHAGQTIESARKTTRSLRQHLLEQIPYRKLGRKQVALIEYIIGLLDAAGYLSVSAAEIAAHTGCTLKQTQQCLQAVRALKPVGVGWANSTESLIYQASARGYDTELLCSILKDNLTDVQAGRIGKIARALSVPLASVQQSVEQMKTLHLSPANGFDGEPSRFITPDLIASWHNDAWELVLNNRWMGTPSISRYYRDLAKTITDPQALAYCKERLSRASFVIGCIEKRSDTLLRVARVLTEIQSDFLLYDAPLRTVTLRDVGRKLELHESTVSRAMHDKYIQCPRGSFPLHGLLSKGSLHGGISRDGIKRALCLLIEEEDKSRPHSDSYLITRLETLGIVVSRRTIAKYREELGIPSSSGRKRARGAVLR